MVLSMTAFGRASCTENGITASVEMRSVNSRTLDIAVRLPRTHAHLEERIKGLLRERFARGRIDVFVEIVSVGQADTVFVVDEKLVESFAGAIKQIALLSGLDIAVSASDFLRQDGLITQTRAETDIAEHLPVLEKAVIQACQELASMRKIEGAALADDLLRHLDQVKALTGQIQNLAGGLPAILKERFVQRMATLAQNAADLDPARMAQEAAFLADKADISEEIVRAYSHVAQFTAIMDGQEPSGRQLNFLAQELHREFSTMGSKSPLAELSHKVVDAKTLVEKIREQVQNVE
ncbi:MAG: YicC/YloC family endoribonuclease [Desulfatibacillaceae bacterium]|nr:YicC/YloC family endoribonuclease [Desulfatibacillaceae bacterium]